MLVGEYRPKRQQEDQADRYEREDDQIGGQTEPPQSGGRPERERDVRVECDLHPAEPVDPISTR